jgi:hypothetical protein
MAEVIEISSLVIDENGFCDVIAVVEDAVQTRAQTYEDPAEYGPALCRGSFYISDDDEVVPVDAESQLQFVGERVSYWEVLDRDNSF